MAANRCRDDQRRRSGMGRAGPLPCDILLVALLCFCPGRGASPEAAPPEGMPPAPTQGSAAPPEGMPPAPTQGSAATAAPGGAPAPPPATAAERTLPDVEVTALKNINSKMKVGWDFRENPCGGKSGWMDTSVTDGPISVDRNLTCGDCDPSNNCHVTAILLKSQNLKGFLPPEFANLTSLVQIDLTRNYINGSLPREWASLPSLRKLSLGGNRISGNIPPEFGNIATLEELVLENNLLQGSIPTEIGRLANLSRLVLSANDLTGELPDSLGNLKNLTDFRIDGTTIFGKVPNFIGNWTGLKKLSLQGTSLEGPFPTVFSTLINLREMHVSDLKLWEFPPLERMKLKYLELRNCSISGTLPSYIGNMSKLKALDLSFNNFTGEIPKTFGQNDLEIDDMYLTNNMFSGVIPKWILRSKENIDLSYNNFTESSELRTCNQKPKLNVVSSYSSSKDSLDPCFRKNFPCSGKAKNSEIFINCGGKREIFEDKPYDEDEENVGASSFFISGNKKWAFSSTGSCPGNGKATYTTENNSVLNMSNPEIYKTARLSPSSLKYYGLCLQNGQYTVGLHFAEIIFKDDDTYFGVGRRFFDVLIQGQLVLEDFNIVAEANGSGRDIIKKFPALVNNHTLEIDFRWSGKGTKSIPQKCVRGPLISAISVTRNFKESKLFLQDILGIVAASFVFIILVIFILCFLRRRNHQNYGGDQKLHTRNFTLRQIRAATGNFDGTNKIGEGGFGPVFKGVLPDGTLVAIKQLSSKSRQGNKEFINEIGMISALDHPNLVKLLGCCIEKDQLFLIYEYLENNSLAHNLFNLGENRLNLDWETRQNICSGIAKGLAFLHEESMLKIVHRDIKATNILLDKDFNPKISDFGFAKLDDQENTHISTRIAGTRGYMAPEYAMRGHLTDKADVYSFGIVMLEIISGKNNKVGKEDIYLLDLACELEEQGRLLELVDENLGSNYPEKKAEQMLKLSILCTNTSPTIRPTMSKVVSLIEGKDIVEIPALKKVMTNSEELKLKKFLGLCNDDSISTHEETIESLISTAAPTSFDPSESYVLPFDGGHLR